MYSRIILGLPENLAGRGRIYWLSSYGPRLYSLAASLAAPDTFRFSPYSIQCESHILKTSFHNGEVNTL